jgi:putative glutamine amidotransferase
MKKPIIAITTKFTSAELAKNPPSAYATAVKEASGEPVLLPCDLPEDEYMTVREKYDGLLLSGGGDIDIRLFNGTPNPAIGTPSPLRDRLELFLARQAVESAWPVFGICRGIQVLNVALGGSLITDIPSQFSTPLHHNTPEEKGRQFLAHEVEIAGGSRLAAIIGEQRIHVNSFHHQAISALAPGLVVTARATDGLIEAVELPNAAKPVFGVQWHPENLQALTAHKAIFIAFIDMCR